MSRDSTIQVPTQFGTFVYRKGDLFDDVEYVGEFFAVTGASQGLGTLNPIRRKDPSMPRSYKIVDKTRSPEDLGEATVNEYMEYDSRSYLEQFKKRRCEVVFINAMMPCGRQDDIHAAESWILVDAADINNVDFGQLGSLTGEDTDANQITGTFSWEEVVRLLPVQFTELGASTVDTEIVDVIYGGSKSCGICSPFAEGCTIYALGVSNTGSPGLSSKIIVVEEDGTVTGYDIDTLGGESGNALAIVGSYLVVVSEGDVAHHYAPLTDLTDWTRVSSGYVAGGGPRAIHVKDTNNVFMAGADGYIYKATDITSLVTVQHDGSLTAQNANEIHGRGSTLVTVHDSNTVLYSNNTGESFSILATDAGLTGPEAGANLTALWVHSQYSWEIGTNTGNLWYTMNEGADFTEKTVDDGLVVINDIFYSEEVGDESGVLAAETLSAGRVYRTITGGRRWTRLDTVIRGLPATTRRINKLAMCDANRIAAGGLGSGSDGILVEAQ